MSANVAPIKALTETEKPTGLALMRKPFEPHQISHLPKPTAKREEMDKLPKATCKICGNWHATSKVIHLEYVGHAALTDRLLDADPQWNWTPVATDANGMPALDAHGGMWIKLTVCGVTRLGYGDAQGKEGPNAVKELIGDALRNAAMRFGAALDLWHKGDLHRDDDDKKDQPKDTGPQAYPQDKFDKNLPAWTKLIAEGSKTAEQIIATVSSKGVLTEAQKQAINDIKPTTNQDTGETTSLLNDVKRHCAASVAIADSETAFLKLDDARILLPDMSAENRELAVKEIDAAVAAIKARAQ